MFLKVLDHKNRKPKNDMILFGNSTIIIKKKLLLTKVRLDNCYMI